MRTLLLALLFIAPPAGAAFEIKKIALGASEADVRKAFPSVNCKALEWTSRAADRRCDDSRVSFGGVEVRVTFYLKNDKLEAYDARYAARDAERLITFLKANYGPPASETIDSFEEKGKKARKVQKVLWERAGERAVLSAQLEKKVGSLLVYRGNFEEEIYRVR